MLFILSRPRELCGQFKVESFHFSFFNSPHIMPFEVLPTVKKTNRSYPEYSPLHTNKQEVSKLCRYLTNIHSFPIKVNGMFQYVRIIIFDLILQVKIDREKALDQKIIVAPLTYSLQLENKNKMAFLAYLLFNIALINSILD